MVIGRVRENGGYGVMLGTKWQGRGVILGRCDGWEDVREV